MAVRINDDDMAAAAEDTPDGGSLSPGDNGGLDEAATAVETPPEDEEASLLEATTTNPRIRYSSLGRATTTPLLATLLIPILTIVTHALFYYAQTRPMWKLHMYQDIHVWANATTTKSKWAFDTLGLPHRNTFDWDFDQDLQQLTYAFSLKALWYGKGLNGILLSRATAILLVMASGIWPHLKLFLLHLTWLFPMRSPVRRQRFLHWLSTLGKWSLADVLAVCVMIAVVDVAWTIDPTAIKHGVLNETPLVLSILKELYSVNDLCTTFLKYDCADAHKFEHVTKCKACTSLIHEAYTHPSWAKSTGVAILQGVETGGGGLVQLSVVGMRGIYIFCLAVIMSILLSLIVDVFDMRARRAAQAQQVTDHTTATTGSSSTGVSDVNDDNNNNNNNNNTLTQGLLRHDHLEVPGGVEPLAHEEDSNHAARPNTNRRTSPHPTPPPVSIIYQQRQESPFICVLRNVFPVVTLVIILLALLLCTMVRTADGALPTLLDEIIGVTFSESFSLRSLVATTGLAGGWDILLMSTCSIFIIVGPVIRALLGVLDFSGLTPERFRRPLTIAIDFIGAFCAWEVIFVSVIMTGLLMPDITGTILMNPKCKIVEPTGTCFKLKFAVQPAFALVAVGGFLLVGQSVFAVYAGRKAQTENEEMLLATTMRMENGSREIKVDEEGGAQYAPLNGNGNAAAAAENSRTTNGVRR